MSEGWKQVWADMRAALGWLPTPAEEEPSPEPSLAVEEKAIGGQVAPEEAPTAAKRRSGWLPAISLTLALAASAFLLWRPVLQRPPQPPAPDVVATFNGGQITSQQLQDHLELLVPEEHRGELTTLTGLRLLVQEMVVDELVRRWAAEKKLDRDEAFQHAMKHITEEINLSDLHAQMHDSEMRVDEVDIQKYYEDNRTRFGEQPLSQVRDEIRAILQSQGENVYIEEYIADLKEKATIVRNFELLDVPPPTEEELLAYYQERREQYAVPRRAMIDGVRVGVGDDEQGARQRAEQALAKLRAGEEFADVAAEFSDVLYVEGGVVVEEGTRGTAFEAVVFALDEGQISQVFQEGDAFHVVRLRRLEPASQRSLDEVREQVWAVVAADKEVAWFEVNADKTLFTIHGQRYTVGEFYREYQELPPDFRIRYRGPQGLKDLAERLIERLVMVEDTYDRMLDTKNRAEIEEVRLDVLKQMLHQEEVDDRIEVSDEEVQQYYDQHQRQMMEPPQARIRYIRIGLGQTDDERQRAWERVNQAYEKLAPGGLFGRGQGADFATVAAEYSEDEATAAKGGQLEGWIGEGYDLLAEMYEHPFHEKVLSLKEGAISRPFEFGGSLYIVQVQERVEPRPLSLEEAQEWIRRELELQKHDELAMRLSQSLLEQAELVVYDDVLREILAGRTGS